MRPCIPVCSIGDTFVIGAFDTVIARSSGTGALFISGVQSTTELSLAGIANAFISQAPEATILGSAGGLSTIQYDAGTCDVAAAFTLFAPCQQVEALQAPPPAPEWTCGLRVAGRFVCSPSGLAFTASATDTTVSAGPGSQPVSTTTASAGGAIIGPSSFVFSRQAVGGGAEEVQEGQVAPGISQASSSVASTGTCRVFFVCYVFFGFFLYKESLMFASR
jgi:hypothetical protein